MRALRPLLCVSAYPMHSGSGEEQAQWIDGAYLAEKGKKTTVQSIRSECLGIIYFLSVIS